METINISDAKSHFSEFLSRAASGERFVILRRERPLAAIIGAVIAVSAMALHRAPLRRDFPVTSAISVLFNGSALYRKTKDIDVKSTLTSRA